MITLDLTPKVDPNQLDLFFDMDIPDYIEYPEDTLSDIEADAMTLASAGMGMDEDYGFF